MSIGLHTCCIALSKFALRSDVVDKVYFAISSVRVALHIAQLGLFTVVRIAAIKSVRVSLYWDLAPVAIYGMEKSSQTEKRMLCGISLNKANVGVLGIHKAQRMR